MTENPKQLRRFVILFALLEAIGLIPLVINYMQRH